MTGRARVFENLFPYVAMMFALVLLQSIMVVTGTVSVTEGELVGNDAYMRLLRVAELHEGGAWHAGDIARSNAPFGETNHWTRPLDALLLLASWAVAPFLGFKSALYWSGVFVSPVLLALACAALAWAAAPILRRKSAPLAMLGLLLQPAVLDYSLIGRADHHALIFLMFVVTIGLTVRLLVRPFDNRVAFALGCALGFGLWLSVEFLMPLALVFGGTSLAWIFEGGDRARRNLHVASGLVIMVAVALFIERPASQVFAPEYNRISIVHLAIGLVAFVFWGAVCLLEGRKSLPNEPTGRALLAGLGAVGATVVIYAAYPKFFGGPMVDVDPRLMALWLDQIIELQPLYVPRSKALAQFIYYLGPALVCIPALVWLLRREWDRPVWLGWAFVAMGLALFVPLAVAHVRLVPYSEILLVIVLVELAGRFGAHFDRILGKWRAMTASSLTTGALLLGFVIVGQTLTHTGRVAALPLANSSCRLMDMAEYLNGKGWADGRPRLILTLFQYGAEILYRTKHSVVATANSFDSAGILDSRRIFTSNDDAESRRLIEQRAVDLILLCPSWRERNFFDSANDEDTFYNRLAEGRNPDWLDPVNLPETLAADFRLYRVVR